MILAGADTGYQNRTGGKPGSGHTHSNADIKISNPNYDGDDLDEVLDEIDTRIDAVEAGAGIVAPHADSHETGGSDPIDIGKLMGQCTQSQVSPAHDGLHNAAFNDGLPVSPDVNGNETLGEHLSDAAIHGGGGGVTSHPALTELEWSASGHVMDTHILPKDTHVFRDIGSTLLRWGAFHGVVIVLYPDLNSASRNILEYNNFFLASDFVFNRDWGAGVHTALHITYGAYKGSDCAAFKTGVNAVFDSNNRPIVNLPAPTEATDAARKGYVDSAVGGINVAKYKYPDILVDDSGDVDAADIPTAFGLIPAGADRHIAFRRGNYVLASDQTYNIGGLLWTGAGEASKIYSSGTRSVLTLSAGDNKIVKITGFLFDNVTLVVNGAKEVHIAECVFENSDLYIGTNSAPVEWAVVENNRFMESGMFYPGTSGNVDHITVKNNYFKRTGTVQSGILDIWWDPEEIFIIDNVIDVSGVTYKDVNSAWYHVIDASTTRNGVVRGNTIIMPASNPAQVVTGAELSGNVKGVWIVEGNKFISNLTRGAASCSHRGVEVFDSNTGGPYFIVSGNYFVDLNVNQGGSQENDFSIFASGSHQGNVVVRNNIHKNCNRSYYPLSGMNVSGDVTYA